MDDTDVSILNINLHTNPAIIFIIPFIMIILFSISLLFIYYRLDKHSDLQTHFKNLFYYILQFLFMPFLFLFLFLNLISILISIIFYIKLYYISLKNFIEFVKECIQKCKKDETKIIKISKKVTVPIQVDYIQPERANKYKEVNDDSKQSEKIIVNNQDNNLNLNAKSIFETQSITRPQMIQKVKDKGKLFEFISNSLLNEKNEPGYITLLNAIKKRANEKVENKNVNKEVVNSPNV